ncbi:hypothetical protein A3J20_05990 [Candidatus Gottesmanbacteria bacterium RIFCSPLOWO2_02_FULL_42_29]|uniref:Uncharacterized protein n=2 Tax=Candidatus Gottesmaniibacteriota TaxID=1752720 RepID=A0A1F6BJW8_9BACT|nr:MAG: hypothetical protein UV09_C0006G0036 [Candidatus Gottesmanbacteria bacterium GW2011_GWA2_42_18]OGG09686.1 MAG: hypothetical protein A2781_00725 [Candidatus Gottesmanbacteria bacterium RIFCSPHIGHO2_01_FULL_42_27]OGG22500.1 MAG: hypothetical protein A3E72_03565 [Candidatus Gottesmanbacteria bacterium RIFCSPHIGHO2_12_FULL_43_26]OGG32831.1 MAG: hypothetical protein A3G68_03395 [Candidatus Gottesmanbacteria bacterium RIFCSPLOWO2_12_FULL_42_10]OGG36565.1 MAG: hypothetical protein A3J20_05990 
MDINVRTTVIIPKDLLKAAKLTAVERQTSVSGLVKQGLKQEIFGITLKKKKAKKLTDLLGKYSIGINKIEREDIYDDYLRKKISP